MWHDVRALNATASFLTALTVLAALISGVWWLSQRPMFSIGSVTVETKLSTPTCMAASRFGAGAGIVAAAMVLRRRGCSFTKRT